jgi:hypothetical protein
MEDDKILESFFDGMKQADAQRPVPPLEKPVPVRRLWPRAIRYSVAAAVTILMVAVLVTVRQTTRETTVQTGDVVIEVGQGSSQTGSLVNMPEQTLSEWTSPTSSLSEDF